MGTMNGRLARALAGAVAATLALASAEPVAAQAPSARPGMKAAAPTTDAAKKIASPLRRLIAEFQALGVTPDTAASLGVGVRYSSQLLHVDGAGRVQVYVWVAGITDATLSALRQHGLDIEIVNADVGVVQGWIAAHSLEPLAGQPVVLKIRLPSYARRRTGSVNSQGEPLHRCPEARAAGVTGAGVKIGVLSTGLVELAASQATGNLPAVEVVEAGIADGEGTAMLEIIHDCAPGAALAFAGATTSLEFVASINALWAAGAQIIVDDLGVFAEPYFEDGLIARNDRVAGEHVLRVSAAGNDAAGHYQSVFAPGVFDADIPGTRHAFGAADTLLAVSVPAGGATAFLQWANPFGAAADDYDLCVRALDGTILGCSVDVQDGDDDPIEALDLPCQSALGCVVDLQVTLFSGVARPLELFCVGCVLLEFNVPADSIFGHPAVPEVLAVAAAPWFNPLVAEPFSSVGPSTVAIPAAEVRAKPDVTGIDQVATGVPGFSPFGGTSAAAPHVAAVAALALERRPAMSSRQLRQLLQGTASGRGAPGFDAIFGFGLADAAAAVAAAPAVPAEGRDAVFAHLDFDGDGRADLGVYRRSTGTWLILRSGDLGLIQVTLDVPALGDVPVPADFDGDGRADLAVFRVATGEWLIRRSSDLTLVRVSWGAPALGDLPVQADFDGDGRADLAVYRQSTGQWLIFCSGPALGAVVCPAGGFPGPILWGGGSVLGDVAVPADFDGDGRADLAVYRQATGQWLVFCSGAGGPVCPQAGFPGPILWGGGSVLGDVAIPADFDGDDIADLAVYRLATGQWLIFCSGAGGLVCPQAGFPGPILWGGGSALGDLAVPADFDGDGRADLAVYRPTTGEWLIFGSSTGFGGTVTFGAPGLGDLPF